MSRHPRSAMVRSAATRASDEDLLRHFPYFHFGKALFEAVRELFLNTHPHPRAEETMVLFDTLSPALRQRLREFVADIAPADVRLLMARGGEAAVVSYLDKLEARLKSDPGMVTHETPKGRR